MSRQSIRDRYHSAKTTVTRDLLAKSVIKATTEEEIPPKEKHLLALESYTRNTLTSMPDFVSALQLRLNSPNWLVVAKSLMAIHHLLINGEERFALYLTSNLSIFSNLFNFPDLIVEQNRNIIDFLNNYVSYLKSKLETYYKLGFDITKSVTSLNFDDKPIKDLLPICKNMNSLTTSIFETQIHKHSVSSKMLLFIFNLINVDVSKLYCCYNNVLTILLKSFYTTDKKTAKDILSQFKHYLKHQNEFSILFESAKEHLGIEESVKVTLIENRVFDEMKSYLDSNGHDKSFLNMDEEIPMEKPQKGELEDLFFNDDSARNPPNIYGQSVPTHEDNFGLLFAENSTSNQVPSQNFDMFSFDPVQNSTPSPQYGQFPPQAPPMQFTQAESLQQLSNPVEPSWNASAQNFGFSQPQSMQQTSNSLFSQQTGQHWQSNIQNPPSSQISGTQLFSNSAEPSWMGSAQNFAPFQPSVGSVQQSNIQNPSPNQTTGTQLFSKPMEPPMQPMRQAMNQFGGMMSQGGSGSKNESSKDPFDFFSI